jgi:CO/xanthine dehydrogenase FAD-binding subunit
MFKYLEPKTVEDYFSLSRRYGAKAKILAGGTELLVNIRQKAIDPQYIINIKKIPNFHFIEYKQDIGLKIGPLTTLYDIENHADIRSKYTAIAEAAHQIGSFQIRNMGTVGGNICQGRKCVYYNQSHINLFMRQSLPPCWARGGETCHAAGKDSLFHSVVGAKKCRASCSSDMLVAFVCFDAIVDIRTSGGSKRVPAKDFWPGPEAGKNVLIENELVSEIRVPSFPPDTRSVYLKYKRDPKDFAISSIAARASIDENRTCIDVAVILGGVAPVPLRVKDIETALKGKIFEPRLIDKALKMILKDLPSRGPNTEFKITKTKRLIEDALILLSKERT